MGSADPNPGWTRAPWAGAVPQHAPARATWDAYPPARPSGAPAADGAACASAARDRALMPPPAAPARDAEPPWAAFFHTALDVAVDGDSFRVYLAGGRGPLVLCLHGAGMTALSFAALTAPLVAAAPCRVAALDMRGHGETRAADEADLSLERLVADVCAVARALLLRAAAEDDAAAAATPHATSAAPPPPPLVIVGHSMGGAVAARVAARMAAREAPDALATALCGVAVLDIVEGTALALAPAMRALLASRPDRFDDLAAARKWARAAPGVAFASQLVPLAGGAGVAWRTPLRATEPFWDGWFRGLSSAFLAPRLPKLLLLADTDRLDDELTIAQMQGRFQLILVPGAGHALHEDAPDATAAALAAFVRRCAPCTSAAGAAVPRPR